MPTDATPNDAITEDRRPVERRARMVERQIARRGVRHEGLLQAMRAVPRERFVAEDLAEFAYEDTPLPIAQGQTIPQPYMVATVLDAAEIAPGERVLEIGTGSGYAAALASRVAERVVSIERHEDLARSARETLEALGFDNVDVRVGDGTRGAPEDGPFDAIIVEAGAPEVPQPLIDQLAQGGRLVVPVGTSPTHQRLMRIRKSGDAGMKREDLGAVAFAPLVGVHGWRDPQAKARARHADEAAAGREAPTGEIDAPEDAAQILARHAEPLPPIEDEAFGRLFDRVGDAQVVALGESSHGTSEFYRARAAITRRLVEEHGFTVIGIEADWPDAAAIDRYVRGLDGRRPGDEPFARFPVWMWRNEEFRALVDWLRARNETIEDPLRRVSVHGLDLYSLGSSLDAVLSYLDRVDPQAAQTARERYGCLTPWQRDPAAYGRAALRSGFQTCESAVLALLRDLLEKRLDYARADGEAFVDAAQNARLVAAAEQYYRAMYYGSAMSWNLRDTHMHETLVAMIHARGPDAKAIVWAHNSHLGNAAATEMGLVREQINIGQLLRETFGAKAALVGFGTDRGRVAAASNWGEEMRVFDVNPALEGSYEALCRDAPTEFADYLLDLRPGRREELRGALMHPRLERAIGVIYRPQTEYASHYFAAALPEQFDLYVWLAETSPVEPLGTARAEGAPDTYPFGL